MLSLERSKMFTLTRILICGVLPFIGRILDVAVTIYGIGLGKKYVNGMVIECVEGNIYTLNLMERYPNYWHLIFLVISFVLIAILFVSRWATIKFNFKYGKYFLYLWDVSTIFVIYFSFSPVFNNLQIIHNWYTYQGGY